MMGKAMLVHNYIMLWFICIHTHTYVYIHMCVCGLIVRVNSCIFTELCVFTELLQSDTKEGECSKRFLPFVCLLLLLLSRVWF